MTIKKVLSAMAAILLAIACVAIISFKNKEKQAAKAMAYAETCTKWDGYGIQFRQCVNDYGLRTHQFYNGFKFQVHFYFFLEYTDGTDSGDNGNIYLNGETYGDKASNDNSSGTNKTVQSWRITKKERKNDAGKWVEF